MDLSELLTREPSEREVKIAFGVVLFIAVSIVFGFNIYVELMSRTFGSFTMQNKVNSITEQDSTDLEKLHSCARAPFVPFYSACVRLGIRARSLFLSFLIKKRG